MVLHRLARLVVYSLEALRLLEVYFRDESLPKELSHFDIAYGWCPLRFGRIMARMPVANRGS